MHYFSYFCYFIFLLKKTHHKALKQATKWDTRKGDQGRKMIVDIAFELVQVQFSSVLFFHSIISDDKI